MLIENDGKTVEQVAREMVERYGADGVPLLHRRVRQAEAVGDGLGAKAWHEIAALAEGMLKDPRRLLDMAEG